MVPADHPTELRRRCEEEAQQMVQLSNSTRDGQQGATNPSLTHLISRLTALLLQIKVEHEEMLGTYLFYYYYFLIPKGSEKFGWDFFRSRQGIRT